MSNTSKHRVVKESRASLIRAQFIRETRDKDQTSNTGGDNGPSPLKKVLHGHTSLSSKRTSTGGSTIEGQCQDQDLGQGQRSDEEVTKGQYIEVVHAVPSFDIAVKETDLISVDAERLPTNTPYIQINPDLHKVDRTTRKRQNVHIADELEIQPTGPNGDEIGVKRIQNLDKVSSRNPESINGDGRREILLDTTNNWHSRNKERERTDNRLSQTDAGRNTSVYSASRKPVNIDKRLMNDKARPSAGLHNSVGLMSTHTNGAVRDKKDVSESTKVKDKDYKSSKKYTLPYSHKQRAQSNADTPNTSQQKVTRRKKLFALKETHARPYRKIDGLKTSSQLLDKSSRLKNKPGKSSALLYLGGKTVESPKQTIINSSEVSLCTKATPLQRRSNIHLPVTYTSTITNQDQVSPPANIQLPTCTISLDGAASEANICREIPTRTLVRTGSSNSIIVTGTSHCTPVIDSDTTARSHSQPSDSSESLPIKQVRSGSNEANYQSKNAEYQSRTQYCGGDDEPEGYKHEHMPTSIQSCTTSQGVVVDILKPTHRDKDCVDITLYSSDIADKEVARQTLKTWGATDTVGLLHVADEKVNLNLSAKSKSEFVNKEDFSSDRLPSRKVNTIHQKVKQCVSTQCTCGVRLPGNCKRSGPQASTCGVGSDAGDRYTGKTQIIPDCDHVPEEIDSGSANNKREHAQGRHVVHREYDTKYDHLRLNNTVKTTEDIQHGYKDSTLISLSGNNNGTNNTAISVSEAVNQASESGHKERNDNVTTSDLKLVFEKPINCGYTVWIQDDLAGSEGSRSDAKVQPTGQGHQEGQTVAGTAEDVRRCVSPVSSIKRRRPGDNYDLENVKPKMNSLYHNDTVTANDTINQTESKGGQCLANTVQDSGYQIHYKGISRYSCSHSSATSLDSTHCTKDRQTESSNSGSSAYSAVLNKEIYSLGVYKLETSNTTVDDTCNITLDKVDTSDGQVADHKQLTGAPGPPERARTDPRDVCIIQPQTCRNPIRHFDSVRINSDIHLQAQTTSGIISGQTNITESWTDTISEQERDVIQSKTTQVNRSLLSDGNSDKTNPISEGPDGMEGRESLQQGQVSLLLPCASEIAFTDNCGTSDSDQYKHRGGISPCSRGNSELHTWAVSKQTVNAPHKSGMLTKTNTDDKREPESTVKRSARPKSATTASGGTRTSLRGTRVAARNVSDSDTMSNVKTTVVRQNGQRSSLSLSAGQKRGKRGGEGDEDPKGAVNETGHFDKKTLRSDVNKQMVHNRQSFRSPQIGKDGIKVTGNVPSSGKRSKPRTGIGESEKNEKLKDLHSSSTVSNIRGVNNAPGLNRKSRSKAASCPQRVKASGDKTTERLVDNVPSSQNRCADRQAAVIEHANVKHECNNCLDCCSQRLVDRCGCASSRQEHRRIHGNDSNDITLDCVNAVALIDEKEISKDEQENGFTSAGCIQRIVCSSSPVHCVESAQGNGINGKQGLEVYQPTLGPTVANQRGCLISKSESLRNSLDRSISQSAVCLPAQPEFHVTSPDHCIDKDSEENCQNIENIIESNVELDSERQSVQPEFDSIAPQSVLETAPLPPVSQRDVPYVANLDNLHYKHRSLEVIGGVDADACKRCDCSADVDSDISQVKSDTPDQNRGRESGGGESPLLNCLTSRSEGDRDPYLGAVIQSPTSPGHRRQPDCPDNCLECLNRAHRILVSEDEHCTLESSCADKTEIKSALEDPTTAVLVLNGKRQTVEDTVTTVENHPLQVRVQNSPSTAACSSHILIASTCAQSAHNSVESLKESTSVKCWQLDVDAKDGCGFNVDVVAGRIDTCSSSSSSSNIVKSGGIRKKECTSDVHRAQMRNTEQQKVTKTVKVNQSEVQRRTAQADKSTKGKTAHTASRPKCELKKGKTTMMGTKITPSNKKLNSRTLSDPKEKAAADKVITLHEQNNRNLKSLARTENVKCTEEIKNISQSVMSKENVGNENVKEDIRVKDVCNAQVEPQNCNNSLAKSSTVECVTIQDTTSVDEAESANDTKGSTVVAGKAAQGRKPPVSKLSKPVSVTSKDKRENSKLQTRQQHTIGVSRLASSAKPITPKSQSKLTETTYKTSVKPSASTARSSRARSTTPSLLVQPSEADSSDSHIPKTNKAKSTVTLPSDGKGPKTVKQGPREVAQCKTESRPKTGPLSKLQSKSSASNTKAAREGVSSSSSSPVKCDTNKSLSKLSSHKCQPGTRQDNKSAACGSTGVGKQRTEPRSKLTKLQHAGSSSNIAKPRTSPVTKQDKDRSTSRPSSATNKSDTNGETVTTESRGKSLNATNATARSVTDRLTSGLGKTRSTPSVMTKEDKKSTLVSSQTKSMTARKSMTVSKLKQMPVRKGTPTVAADRNSSARTFKASSGKVLKESVSSTRGKVNNKSPDVSSASDVDEIDSHTKTTKEEQAYTAVDTSSKYTNTDKPTDKLIAKSSDSIVSTCNVENGPLCNESDDTVAIEYSSKDQVDSLVVDAKSFQLSTDRTTLIDSESEVCESVTARSEESQQPKSKVDLKCGENIDGLYTPGKVPRNTQPEYVDSESRLCKLENRASPSMGYDSNATDVISERENGNANDIKGSKESRYPEMSPANLNGAAPIDCYLVEMSEAVDGRASETDFPTDVGPTRVKFEAAQIKTSGPDNKATLSTELGNKKQECLLSGTEMSENIMRECSLRHSGLPSAAKPEIVCRGSLNLNSDSSLESSDVSQPLSDKGRSVEHKEERPFSETEKTQSKYILLKGDNLPGCHGNGFHMKGEIGNTENTLSCLANAENGEERQMEISKNVCDVSELDLSSNTSDSMTSDQSSHRCLEPNYDQGQITVDMDSEAKCNACNTGAMLVSSQQDCENQISQDVRSCYEFDPVVLRENFDNVPEQIPGERCQTPDRATDELDRHVDINLAITNSTVEESIHEGALCPPSERQCGHHRQVECNREIRMQPPQSLNSETADCSCDTREHYSNDEMCRKLQGVSDAQEEDTCVKSISMTTDSTETPLSETVCKSSSVSEDFKTADMYMSCLSTCENKTSSDGTVSLTNMEVSCGNSFEVRGSSIITGPLSGSVCLMDKEIRSKGSLVYSSDEISQTQSTGDSLECGSIARFEKPDTNARQASDCVSVAPILGEILAADKDACTFGNKVKYSSNASFSTSEHTRLPDGDRYEGSIDGTHLPAQLDRLPRAELGTTGKHGSTDATHPHSCSVVLPPDQMSALSHVNIKTQQNGCSDGAKEKSNQPDDSTLDGRDYGEGSPLSTYRGDDQDSLKTDLGQKSVGAKDRCTSWMYTDKEELDNTASTYVESGEDLVKAEQKLIESVEKLKTVVSQVGYNKQFSDENGDPCSSIESEQNNRAVEETGNDVLLQCDDSIKDTFDVTINSDLVNISGGLAVDYKVAGSSYVNDDCRVELKVLPCLVQASVVPKHHKTFFQSEISAGEALCESIPDQVDAFDDFCDTFVDAEDSLTDSNDDDDDEENDRQFSNTTSLESFQDAVETLDDIESSDVSPIDGDSEPFDSSLATATLDSDISDTCSWDDSETMESQRRRNVSYSSTNVIKTASHTKASRLTEQSEYRTTSVLKDKAYLSGASGSRHHDETLTRNTATQRYKDIVHESGLHNRFLNVAHTCTGIPPGKVHSIKAGGGSGWIGQEHWSDISATVQSEPATKAVEVNIACLPRSVRSVTSKDDTVSGSTTLSDKTIESNEAKRPDSLEVMDQRKTSQYLKLTEKFQSSENSHAMRESPVSDCGDACFSGGSQISTPESDVVFSNTIETAHNVDTKIETAVTIRTQRRRRRQQAEKPVWQTGNDSVHSLFTQSSCNKEILKEKGLFQVDDNAGEEGSVSSGVHSFTDTVTTKTQQHPLTLDVNASVTETTSTNLSKSEVVCKAEEKLVSHEKPDTFVQCVKTVAETNSTRTVKTFVSTNSFSVNSVRKEGQSSVSSADLREPTVAKCPTSTTDGLDEESVLYTPEDTTSLKQAAEGHNFDTVFDPSFIDSNTSVTDSNMATIVKFTKEQESNNSSSVVDGNGKARCHISKIVSELEDCRLSSVIKDNSILRTSMTHETSLQHLTKANLDKESKNTASSGKTSSSDDRDTESVEKTQTASPPRERFNRRSLRRATAAICTIQTNEPSSDGTKSLSRNLIRKSRSFRVDRTKDEDTGDKEHTETNVEEDIQQFRKVSDICQSFIQKTKASVSRTQSENLTKQTQSPAPVRKLMQWVNQEGKWLRIPVNQIPPTSSSVPKGQERKENGSTKAELRQTPTGAAMGTDNTDKSETAKQIDTLFKVTMSCEKESHENRTDTPQHAEDSVKAHDECKVEDINDMPSDIKVSLSKYDTNKGNDIRVENPVLATVNAEETRVKIEHEVKAKESKEHECSEEMTIEFNIRTSNFEDEVNVTMDKPVPGNDNDQHNIQKQLGSRLDIDLDHSGTISKPATKQEPTTHCSINTCLDDDDVPFMDDMHDEEDPSAGATMTVTITSEHADFTEEKPSLDFKDSDSASALVTDSEISELESTLTEECNQSTPDSYLTEEVVQCDTFEQTTDKTHVAVTEYDFITDAGAIDVVPPCAGSDGFQNKHVELEDSEISKCAPMDCETDNTNCSVAVEDNVTEIESNGSLTCMPSSSPESTIAETSQPSNGTPDLRNDNTKEVRKERVPSSTETKPIHVKSSKEISVLFNELTKPSTGPKVNVTCTSPNVLETNEVVEVQEKGKHCQAMEVEEESTTVTKDDRKDVGGQATQMTRTDFLFGLRDRYYRRKPYGGFPSQSTENDDKSFKASNKQEVMSPNFPFNTGKTLFNNSERVSKTKTSTENTDGGGQDGAPIQIPKLKAVKIQEELFVGKTEYFHHDQQDNDLRRSNSSGNLSTELCRSKAERQGITSKDQSTLDNDSGMDSITTRIPKDNNSSNVDDYTMITAGQKDKSGGLTAQAPTRAKTPKTVSRSESLDRSLFRKARPSRLVESKSYGLLKDAKNQDLQDTHFFIGERTHYPDDVDERYEKDMYDDLNKTLTPKSASLSERASGFKSKLKRSIFSFGSRHRLDEGEFSNKGNRDSNRKPHVDGQPKKDSVKQKNKQLDITRAKSTSQIEDVQRVVTVERQQSLNRKKLLSEIAEEGPGSESHLRGLDKENQSGTSHRSSVNSCADRDLKVKQAAVRRSNKRRSLSLPTGSLVFGEARIVYKDGHFTIETADGTEIDSSREYQWSLQQQLQEKCGSQGVLTGMHVSQSNDRTAPSGEQSSESWEGEVTGNARPPMRRQFGRAVLGKNSFQNSDVFENSLEEQSRNESLSLSMENGIHNNSSNAKPPSPLTKRCHSSSSLPDTGEVSDEVKVVSQRAKRTSSFRKAQEKGGFRLSGIEEDRDHEISKRRTQKVEHSKQSDDTDSIHSTGSGNSGFFQRMIKKHKSFNENTLKLANINKQNDSTKDFFAGRMSLRGLFKKNKSDSSVGASPMMTITSPVSPPIASFQSDEDIGSIDSAPCSPSPPSSEGKEIRRRHTSSDIFSQAFSSATKAAPTADTSPDRRTVTSPKDYDRASVSSSSSITSSVHSVQSPLGEQPNKPKTPKPVGASPRRNPFLQQMSRTGSLKGSIGSVDMLPDGDQLRTSGKGEITNGQSRSRNGSVTSLTYLNKQMSGDCEDPSVFSGLSSSGVGTSAAELNNSLTRMISETSGLSDVGALSGKQRKFSVGGSSDISDSPSKRSSGVHESLQSEQMGVKDGPSISSSGSSSARVGVPVVVGIDKLMVLSAAEMTGSYSNDSGIQHDVSVHSSSESLKDKQDSHVKLRQKKSLSPNQERPRSEVGVRWADHVNNSVAMETSDVQVELRKRDPSSRARPRPKSDLESNCVQLLDELFVEVLEDFETDGSSLFAGGMRAFGSEVNLLNYSSLRNLYEVRRNESEQSKKSRRMSTPHPIKSRLQRSPRKFAKQAPLVRSNSMPDNLQKMHKPRRMHHLLDFHMDSMSRHMDMDDCTSDDSDLSFDRMSLQDKISLQSSSSQLTSMDEEEENWTYAEALWDHITMDTEELGFRAGDLIEVTDLSDKDWWFGSIDDCEGWFPAAFVRLRVNQDQMEDELEVTVCENLSCSPKLRRISILNKDQARANVVNEIINAEREYVKHLKDVVEGYIQHARKRTEMFSEDRIQLIFGNLEDIYRSSCKFLSELEKCIDVCPHLSQIGECFLNNVKGFEIYSDYCNNHPSACEELKMLYHNTQYRHFFEACRLLQELIEIPLEGFLLTPVQKICKYPLQLAELLKYTPPNHADYHHVENAHGAMKKIAKLINERKRKMESIEKIAAWQQTVDDWEGEDLLESSSELIHSGELNKINTAGWSQERWFYLFDHQLIYCKKELLKRHMFSYKGRIDLDHCEVIPIPDGKDVQYNVTVKNAWKLHETLKDKWYLLYAKTQASKERWLKALKDERRRVEEDKENDFCVPEHWKLTVLNKVKSMKDKPVGRPDGMGLFQKDPYKDIPAHATLPRRARGASQKQAKKKGWFPFGGGKKSKR